MNWDLYTKTSESGVLAVTFKAAGRSLEAVERWCEAVAKAEENNATIAAKYGADRASHGRLKRDVGPGFVADRNNPGWALPNKRTTAGRKMEAELKSTWPVEFFNPHAKVQEFGDAFEVGADPVVYYDFGKFSWPQAYRLGGVWLINVPRPVDGAPCIPLDAIPLRRSEVEALREAAIEFTEGCGK